MSASLPTDSQPPGVASEGTAHHAHGSVLELVLLRVRLSAARRAAWLQHLGANRQLAPGEVNNEPALEGTDDPQAEYEWYESSRVVERHRRGLARVEAHLEGDAGTPLKQLQSLFGLSQAECDLLQACLALFIDPALGSVFAGLQGHAARSFVTDALAARLFGHGRQVIWAAESPLASWGLVSAAEAAAGEPRALTCDPYIVRWLQATLHIDPALIGAARLIDTRESLSRWPVTDTASLVHRCIDRGSAIRVLVVGPAGSGRRTFAAAVAAHFGIPAVAIDTAVPGDGEWPDACMRTQRMALLGGMAPVWHGECLHRRWPEGVPPVALQFIACDESQVVPPCEQAIDYRVKLPAPTLDERRELWRSQVPESAAWDAREREALVSTYRLNVGDLVTIARHAPADARQAARMARELTRDRLGELGQLLECPFGWDDLVVPAKLRDALEDFAFEARERAGFWEAPGPRRLFPRGRGLVALFSGPPGTGKTMAAQVVAAGLELDLFRIDLATVVSKYIGETAKHLRQIFARAARMNAVLLFDEADALFSKRTDVKDAHDRYANADTGYLLQQLEEHRGIVVLATNKKQNIDPAFTRRVRYVYEFPRPTRAERERIWRAVIAELTDDENRLRLAPGIERLAATVEMSGAQIKNAILASIFVARRTRAALAMSHLVTGVERELGKEGRALGAHERERLLRDG